jgi:hypothetical protein
MDKKAIKTFAIDARKKIIREIQYKANLLGITADGIAEPFKESDGMEVYDIGGNTPYKIYDKDIKSRKELVRQIKEKGFDNVVEEVAYTWFNRIIAIRFMEVNDYLPTGVRVLSSETEGKIEPDIVTEAQNIDLNFNDEEIETIYQLKSENKLDELFRILFIKQCNKLNEILPELFEKTADYTELLLSISFTNQDGVVRQLIDSISEENFTDQVEIIGWLYQYYNTELKEDTFKQLKKRVKISKERIPAATQLFTPDWIVRYMVENSLGRLWLEGHPDSDIKEKWKYYLDEAEQEPEVQIELAKIREDSKNLKPEDIKIIDPAMGSGHIIVYAFEVLMQIYTSVGYSERDAAESIIKNNLYGLDIDDRAYQLAYFAVMMKARSYNRKILSQKIIPQICSIKESNNITEETINFVANDDLEIKTDLNYLKETFIDAKEYGSIIDVKNIDFTRVEDYLKKASYEHSNLLKTKYGEIIKLKILPVVKQAKILSKSYEIVITNPPYMGANRTNKKLIDYLKIHYPLTKNDLYAVFIEKGINLTRKNMFNCMVTMQTWMFISSFKKMREELFNRIIITNLLHMDSMVMGIAFGTSATVFRKNEMPKFKGTYNQIKLKDINEFHSPNMFPVPENRNNAVSIENFTKIPGSPVAYWANNKLINAFIEGKGLLSISEPKIGLQTGDNNRFLRFWHEININKCGFGFKNSSIANNSQKKWFPYNKGGKFRNWYGNQEYVVNYENDGFELKNFKPSYLRNMPYYFSESISWSRTSSGRVAFRYFPTGFIFDIAGPSMFFKQKKCMFYILGFLNSKVSAFILSLISPTLNYELGQIISLPILYSNEYLENVTKIVKENIKIVKEDWESFETSWNFEIHPLLKLNRSTVENAYVEWKTIKDEDFLKLKTNEIELNKIFIDIYDIGNDLSPHDDDKYISTHKASLINNIKSFISYAVGCMLGRYSLDEEGLIFAGGSWDPSKYSKFVPDDDNIIPILDTEYFEDDIVGRFVDFVKVTFGEDTLEENLDFIASALKKKGSTSRDVIRNYFLTDFYKDHLQTYKKHPIYWLFDSGKNNGFKALIYMHRYEPDLVARVRTDYLHKTQKALETAISHNERIIDNSPNASEKSKAVKAKDKLIKQLEETRKYDVALAHLANQKIELDLDDGVKVNYAKFQGLEVSSEGKKAVKVNLLKKI